MRGFLDDLKKMKGMSLRQALGHIREYYKVHLLILALVLFFLIGGLRIAFGPRVETVLSAVLVDSGVTEEAVERAETELNAWMGLDPETQRAELQTVLIPSDNAVAVLQSLIVRVASGETDLFLSRSAVTNYLLKSSVLRDPREVLAPGVLERWSDRLVYMDARELEAWLEAWERGDVPDEDLLRPGPEGLAEPVAVALDLTEAAETVFDRPRSAGPLYAALSANSKHPDSLNQVLNWLDSRPSP